MTTASKSWVNGCIHRMSLLIRESAYTYTKIRLREGMFDNTPDDVLATKDYLKLIPLVVQILLRNSQFVVGFTILCILLR